MATTVSSVSISDNLTTKESLSSAAASGAVITSSAYNPTPKTLSGTSTPPVTKYVAEAVAQASGGGAKTATIDLTACNGTTGTLDLSGLKVQMIRLIAASTNTGIVTIQPAASNGYALFGASNDVDVQIGGKLIAEFGNDKLADVSGTAKYIELVGTSLDTYTLEIWAG